MEAKRLQRSDDAVIAGVCAGLADYFNIDAVIVRVLAVVLGLASFGITALVYILFWLIMPATPKHTHPIDVACAQNAYSNCAGSDTGAGVSGSCQDGSTLDSAVNYICNTTATNKLCRVGVWIGVLLVVVGLAGAFAAVVRGISWWQFWPIVLVLGGIAQMLLPARKVLRAGRIASGIAITALGLLLLACSLHIIDWISISLTFGRFWSLLVVTFGLLLIGGALRNGVYTIAGALVFAFFCLLGLTVCSIPGALEIVIVQFPFFDPWVIQVSTLFN